MELVQRVHEASGLGRPRPEDPIHPLDRDLLGSAQLGRTLGMEDGALIRWPGCTGRTCAASPRPSRVLPRPRGGAAAGLGHGRAADAGGGHPDERPAGQRGAADAAGRLHPPPGALHHRPPGRAHRGGGHRAASAAAAGDVLPRPGRLHPAHRGARRPGGGGAGHQPGRPGRAGVAPTAASRSSGSATGSCSTSSCPARGWWRRWRWSSGPRRPACPGPRRPARRAGGVPGRRLLGRTVNLAARIAGHAGPGEVLVSDEVVAECAGGAVAFEPIGAVPLKGVADPVPLHGPPAGTARGRSGRRPGRGGRPRGRAGLAVAAEGRGGRSG